MTVIGLTGSFGSGKTFVASIFKELGAKVIDADKIAHKAIKKGTKAYGKIAVLFGSRVLDGRGEVDRKKLGKIVFADKRLLERLNRIVHPQVIKYIKGEVRKVDRGAGVLVIDAPLLVEADLAGLVDKLVVVKCSKTKQVERCEKKFCLKKEEVLKRIASQIPLKRKMAMADYVVENSRAKLETRKQVRKLWEEMSWR